jgi:nitronate monooxygenase
MDFGSGSSRREKAWRDIWGAGQGTGQIHDVPTTAELVDRLEREYHAARARLGVAAADGTGGRAA